MNIIHTMNIGGCMSSNARDSMEASARRWNCMYVEHLQPWGTSATDDPFGIKLEIHKLAVNDGDRILWLDSDMLIRHDCPNPFEIVPAESIGGVLNFQGDTHDGDPGPTHATWWAKTLPLFYIADPPKYDPATYINGGFMLLTVGKHDQVWQVANKAVRSFHTGRVNPMIEQTAVNIAIAALKLPLYILPHTFNRIGKAAWLSDEHMTEPLYHFANIGELRGHKRQVIDSISWEPSIV